MLNQFGLRTLTFNTPTLDDLARKQLHSLSSSLLKLDGITRVDTDTKQGKVVVQCKTANVKTLADTIITMINRSGVTFAELESQTETQNVQTAERRTRLAK